MRVEAKTAFMQVFDAARAAVRAEGRRLAADGLLADPDDVFYLTVDELLHAPRPDVAATVAERRATRDRYLGVELPLEWVGMPEPLTRRVAAGSGDGHSITALGVSSGTVEGRAVNVSGSTASMLLTCSPSIILRRTQHCHQCRPAFGSGQ